MEWLTILISGFLAAIAPAGLIIDQVIASQVRQQMVTVDTLQVRVDNVPSYQILQGKVDKIRIASRGLQPIENLRIDLLEIETDPLSLDFKGLQESQSLRQILRQPLQGGLRIRLTDKDLNQALNSEQFKSQFQKNITRFLPESAPQFQLVKTDIQFLEDQTISLTVFLDQVDEETQKTERLTLNFVSGFQIIGGRSLKFVNPQARLNNQKLSSRFLNTILEGFSGNLDLQILEKQGIITRIIKVNLEQGHIDLALFVRLEPS